MKKASRAAPFLALAVLPVLSATAGAQQPGDWARYEETVEFKDSRVRRLVTVTITKVDVATGALTKSVQAETSGDISLLSSLEGSIDQLRDFLETDPRQTPKTWTATVTRSVKEGREPVTISGRTYGCSLIESTGTLGPSGEWNRKLWICPDVVIFERVKGEVTTVKQGYAPVKLTRRLLDFSAPRTVDRRRLR